MATLEERLKQLREELGLSQRNMAVKLGVSATTYNGYERGLKKISEAAMEKLQKQFGFALEEPKAEEPGEVAEAEEAVQAAGPEEAARASEPEEVAEPVQPAPDEETETVEAAANEKAADSQLPQMLVQSLMGGEISVDEVIKKVLDVAPKAEKIYIKPEENRAYWTLGTSTGCVFLWE